MVGRSKLNVAKVILDLDTRTTKTYDYLIPPRLSDEVDLGATVVVPVRQGERLGYVVDFAGKAGTFSLKEIAAVVPGAGLIGQKLIQLCRWTASYYLLSLGDALQLTLPPGAKHRLVPVIELSNGPVSEEPAAAWLAGIGSPPVTQKQFEARFDRSTLYRLLKKGVANRRFVLAGPTVKPKIIEFAALTAEPSPLSVRGAKQQAVLEALAEESPRPVADLLSKCGAGRTTLTGLVEKGLVTVFSRREERLTATSFTGRTQRQIDLSPDQKKALLAITEALKESRSKTALLEGVTGSGKTEIYIRAATVCLAAGRSAIFLVPEIALLPQLAERLAARFGEQVAVLHSGLPAGERLDAWTAVAGRRKNIIVGARSAIFAPVADLGLVVIDEEHETSYKQNSAPRYDARKVAAKLAELHNAVLLLGSATPSLESQSLVKKIGLHLRLPERAAGMNRPRIQIVDMRREIEAGNYTIFSRELVDRLDSTLNAGHKAILLLNRRGFASFLLCRQCGHVPGCDNCSVSLTYHRFGNTLLCHHCDSRHAAPDACPNCGNLDWRYTGSGTQRVEDELEMLFPHSTVIRMDADTTARLGAHREQLLRFLRSEKAILLGTQMIAKGLDFPEVALVGIINADTALNLPDFRAAERTAQLLIQVSGRSGRGSVPGEVIIQTYNPEHYAVQAVNRDYGDFCSIEIGHRKELDYPPFSSMVNVIFSSPDQRASELRAKAAAEELRRALPEDRVLGPAPAPLVKIKGYWRWHFMIMTRTGERVKYILSNSERLMRPDKNVRVIVDVDPVWLL